MRWSEVSECHERGGGGGRESGDEWTHKAGGVRQIEVSGVS